MQILLTNDDGFDSLGINTLKQVLVNAGHDVWICAPSGQRSATSHAMTLRDTISITQFDDTSYHCSGTPADCVLYGLKGKAIPIAPDVIISGINHGYNVSTDILYSGTVGAAREAALMGIKAIAISAMCDESGSFPFTQAAGFLASHLDEFLPLCTDKSFININVPPCPNGQWKVGCLGLLEYCDVVERYEDSSEHVYDGNDTQIGTSSELGCSSYRLKGGIAPMQRCDTPDTDFSLVMAGSISVTSLNILPALDLQTNEMLEALSRR